MSGIHRDAGSDPVTLEKAAVKLKMQARLQFPAGRDLLTSQRVVEAGFGVALFGLLLLTWWLYLPGLTGPLVLDDLWNLEPLGEGGGVDSLDRFRQFVFGNNSGPTGRPIAMASFLLDAQDWPARVPALKHTNVLLHLLGGTLLFWFALLLCDSLGKPRTQGMQIALLVAAFWLLHPINNSTVLYVVQRMTQLMTLFALAALICYLAARKCLHLSPFKAYCLLGLCLFPFAMLSVLSKENGALLLILIVLMESLLFSRRQVAPLFVAWYRIGILLPLGIVLLYLLVTLPESLAGYETRTFSLMERLLTQSRVLSSYIFSILIPGLVEGSVFHDDFQISHSLLSPPGTLAAIIFLLALLTSAVIVRKKQPVYSFSVLWYFSLQVLESSYLPLELYFEHRNYFPMIGPAFGLAFYLHSLVVAAERKELKQAAVVAAGVVLVFSTWLSWDNTNRWSNGLNLHAVWAEEKPRSMRAQTTYAEYLNALDMPDAAMERLRMLAQHYPNEITVKLFMWNHSCEYGLPQPFTLQTLIMDEQLEYSRDDINFYLARLLENLINNRCDYPNREVLIALFERIDQFNLTLPRKASFYVYFSDLFVYFGMLDPALINLSKSYELNPVPDLPVRQALLSASAGDFRSALIFLERAKQADQQRNPLIPSVMDEILQLEADFESRL